MKKILTLFFILFALTVISQPSQRAYEITISGATTSPLQIPVGNYDYQLIHIRGSKSLTTDFVIEPTGTPSRTVTVQILYTAVLTPTSTQEVYIFGDTIPSTMIRKEFLVTSTYIDATWFTVIVPDAGAKGWIGPGSGGIDFVDDATFDLGVDDEIILKDGGVGISKLETITAGQIIVANSGGVPTAVTLSGDVLISSAGVSSLGSGVVGTTELANESVTTDKMADLTQGYILVGGASDRPTSLDANDAGKVLVGTGTDVASVSISGDVTMTSGGVVSIGAGAVGPTEIADEAVTAAKMADLTAGYVLVGNSSDRPTAVAMSGDATLSSTGVITVTKTIDESDISSAAVTPVKLASSIVLTDGINGPILVKVLKMAQIKPLLDGTVRQLIAVGSSEDIIGVNFIVKTAAGTTGIVDVGVDAAAQGGSADGDGLMVDVDANVAGVYVSPLSAETVAGFVAYTGDLLKAGYFTTAASGYITIQSSTNLTASSIDGSIIIYYTP